MAAETYANATLAYVANAGKFVSSNPPMFAGIALPGANTERGTANTTLEIHS